MMKTSSLAILSVFLCVALWMTTMMLSMSTKKQNLQKSSSFECGFDPLSPMDHSFSMPFFIIALMFLLFDVEIILVMVKPINESSSIINSSNSWAILLAIPMCTLLEWKKGILKWM